MTDRELLEEQTMNDPLSDFQEGQWWVRELDKAAATVGATDDFRRAVAVVHHLLRSAAAEIGRAK